MERVLATGGTGYIGSHTVVELLAAGYEVDVLDNLFNSKIEVLDRIEEIAGKRPGFYQVSLLEADKVQQLFRERRYDLVVHFAGLKAVGESVEKPLEYYENNVAGTVNLLKGMREAGTKRIVFSSSATVYGEPAGARCVEEMETGRKLTSPYGRTKYMIEEILKDCAAAEPGLAVAILRYFNPVGNHESGLIGEDPNGIPNNLMPIIMKVARGEMKELAIFGEDYPTPDGTCLRDYVHVVDLAKGHVRAIEKLRPGVAIYNLGTGKATSVKEMVKAFETASGEKLPVRVAGRRAGDLPELCADVSKAERELGWKAERNVEDAMRDTLKFLRK